MKNATTKTLSARNELCSNWFIKAEETLSPLREAARVAQQNYWNHSCTTTKNHWHHRKKVYLKAQKEARTEYCRKLAMKATKQAMRGDSRSSWKAIRTLQEGSTAHHKDPFELTLRNPSTGIIAMNPRESVAILNEFCTKLYTRDDAPVDWTILNEVPQQDMIVELGLPPDQEEVENSIRKLKNHKAPGESGIPAEALKELTSSAIEPLTQLIRLFWKDKETVFSERQTAQLKWLFKKGDRKEAMNYQGIVLQDALARLTSSTITGRLQKILEPNGIEEQFGSQPGRGTIDALYTLRSALQLRREHQTDSYVLFIDLIKAFDTANHALLFRLLGKYGPLPELVAVIEKLHENIHLKLEIEKEASEIPYTVGVKQGGTNTLPFSHDGILHYAGKEMGK